MSEETKKRKTQSDLFPSVQSKKLHDILHRIPSRYEDRDISPTRQHPLRLSTWGLHNPDDDGRSLLGLEHQDLYDALLSTFRPSTGSMRFITKNASEV